MSHSIPYEVRLEGRTIILFRKTENLFDTVVPFIFPREHVTIVLPSGIKIVSGPYSTEPIVNAPGGDLENESHATEKDAIPEPPRNDQQ